MTNSARLRRNRHVRRALSAGEFDRWARARSRPINDALVYYESFGGNGMLCNPEAIFRALLVAPDMQHLHHVWGLSDLDAHAETVDAFARDDRVEFVQIGTQDYRVALSTAKYLVNNATFPRQFGKRDGQMYLNTWHGTPLKAMGYDIPGGVLATRNVVRNFLCSDFLLAPNKATEEMYLSAYRMRNIYRGKMILEATPDRSTFRRGRSSASTGAPGNIWLVA